MHAHSTYYFPALGFIVGASELFEILFPTITLERHRSSTVIVFYDAFICNSETYSEKACDTPTDQPDNDQGKYSVCVAQTI